MIVQNYRHQGSIISYIPPGYITKLKLFWGERYQNKTINKAK